MKRGNFALVVAFVFAFVASIVAQPSGSRPCVTTTGLEGICIRVQDCLPIVMLLTREPLEPEDIAYMRANRCDKASQVPRICCVPEGA